MEIEKELEQILSDDIYKAVISKPDKKRAAYRRLEIQKNERFYQLTKYTETQAFHENLEKTALADMAGQYLGVDFFQMNAWSAQYEYQLMVSKKGKVSVIRKKTGAQSGAPRIETAHNKQKKYLLPEGMVIPPLVDMGIFTKEGKIVRSMYDKFKQINRFLELVEDELRKQDVKHLRIIDFGCGKSYLTFILYYYLTQVRGISVDMTGLDLKADVIAECEAAAVKYGYSQLHFELGDISGYQCSGPVDMVVTLHACDTATDYALYHAVCWNAKMIFSVPCCQHELNGQIRTERLQLLTRYGIVKERFSALATDAVHANMLEYAGYKVQLLEFVDLSHTPKNLLIRAVRRPVMPKGYKEKMLRETEELLAEFHTEQKLHELLLQRSKEEGES